jgi:hypothetical protein
MNRFVVLPDCGHVVEVLGLERWLSWQAAKVYIRSCPRCNTPIRSLPRYKNIVRETEGDLSSIKQRLFLHQHVVTKKTNDLRYVLQNLQGHKLITSGTVIDNFR